MGKVLLTAVLTLFAALSHGGTSSTGLIFNGNGGKVSYGDQQNRDSVKVPAIKQTENVYYCDPSQVTATRTGFRFTRWYNDDSTTKPCSLKPNGGITAWQDEYRNVYAGWNEADYYVVFHANAGEGTMADQKQLTGIAGNLSSNAFTRANHHFVGWAPSESGQVKYADGAALCLASDPPYNDTAKRYEYHLYALWEEDVYPVVYCSNDEHNYLKTNAVVVSKNVILKNTFSRQGYRFTQWNTKADGSGNTYEVDAECSYIAPEFPNGLFLYAQWTPQAYEVTFIGNGGGNPSFQDKQVVYDEPYGILPTCAREGYDFLGWWTQTAAGERIEATNIVKITTSQNLYAHWSAHGYTVTLAANGGDTPIPASTNIVFGNEYGELATCTRTGYDFSGWWTAPEGGTRVWPSTTLSTAQDHTLYAHWTAHQYSVAFAANGGEGAMAMLAQRTYDEPFALTSNVFTRIGYDFLGWTDTNGVHYADGETVSNLTAAAGVTVALSAEWQPQSFTVTFIPGGGTVDPASKTVVYDAAYGELPTPTRGFYKFVGWFTAEDGGDQVLPTMTVAITADQPLYAHWLPPQQFTVTFDAGGGSAVATLSVTEGETYPEFLASTRFGYEFLGWFTAADGGEQVQVGDDVREENLTLYAHWEKLTSEFSKALDTTDFYFVSETNPAWFVTDLTGTTNGSCLAICGAGTSLSNPAKVYAVRERAESGQLSVAWSLVCSKTPKPSTGGNLSVVLYCETGAQNKYVTKLKSSLDGDPLTISVPSNCTRIEFAYYVDGVSGKEKYYAYLDHLVWIPDEVPAVIEVGPGDTSVTVQEGQTLCFKKDGYDITEFLNIPEPVNGVIDLTQVTVKDEYVHEPFDPAAGAVLKLDSESPSIKTAPTRAGLTYILYEGATLDGMLPGAKTIGDGEPWLPVLTVKGGASAFYMIKVTQCNE